jgi:TonB-dependent siderophore receptor
MKTGSLAMPRHDSAAPSLPPFALTRLAFALQASLLATALGAAASSQDALAQTTGTEARKPYSIPAGPLEDSLNRFARQAGITLSFDPAQVAGRMAPALQGSLTVREGLAALLAGQPLEAVRATDGTYSLRAAPLPPKASPTPAAAATETALAEVRVKAAPEGRFGETPPERGGFNAEYQTSSTKTPLEIRETPQAISVVTRDSMDARLARDIGSALELSAGASAAARSSGGPFAGYSRDGGENFTLRGETLNGFRDVRIDGYAVNSIFQTFDTAAFERVEAVKGPSSMLYGQGSLGGFINLVRKKPQAEKAVSATVQAGSWNTYRTEIDATGALDGDKRLLGRITAAYEDAGSFVDGKENQRLLLAPSLEARMGPRTRALLDVLYQDDRFIPSAGMPLRQIGNRLVIPNIDRSLFVGVPSQEKSDKNSTSAALRVDHELSDRWLATLSLQGGRQKHRNVFDSYGYAGGGLPASGAVGLYSSLWESRNDFWAGEVRLDGKFNAFGREHRLLTGLEKNRRKTQSAYGYTYLGIGNIYTNNFAAVGTFPGGANTLNAGNSALTSNNEAAYGQVILSLLDRTRLLLGARVDRIDQERYDNLLGATTGQKSDRAGTFRLGLTQDLSRNVTAYASYAESFSPVEALSRTGAILDPETGKGYELGLKSEWLNKRLGATVAVFRQELDNRPISDPNNGPGQFFFASGGLQRTRGAELEIAGSPKPGLTLGFAGSRIDAEYVDPLDPNFGLRPEGSTEYQLGLFARYELQDGDWKGFGFGATVVNVGDRVLLQGGSNLFIDGYERVDLGFYYKGLPGWNLSLQVRNLFDKTYVERYSNVPGFENHFGSPRAALFRVAYQFK